MQHYEIEGGCVEKSSYWIHSSAYWSNTHPFGARIRTPAHHPEHAVSQREIQLG